MGLKYFLKTKYNNVGDALSDIRKELKGLWNAVDGRRIEDVTPAEPQSYIPDISSQVAHSYGYDGDFTIVVEPSESSEQTLYNIKIVNGELYKVNKDLNHSLTAWINGKHYLIQAKVFNNIDLTDGYPYYIYIIYTAEGVEPSPPGEPASEASAVLEGIRQSDWNYLPSDDVDHAYYLIGKVYLGYGNKLYINQGHQSGYVRMYHAMSCSDVLHAVEPEETAK